MLQLKNKPWIGMFFVLFSLLSASAAYCMIKLPSKLTLRALPKTRIQQAQPLSGLPATKPNTRALHIADYKGTQKLFKPECARLSPLAGPPLQETGWLQRNWELIPDSATAQLIASPENGLFYKLQSQFRPTQNKSLPGYSLTPKLLGQLIGYMETGAIFDLESPVMKEFIASWRAEHKKLTGSHITLKRIRAFLELVQKALQETNKDFGEPLYLPYTPHNILWAFLYRKFDNKQDLADALRALHQIAPCLQDESILSDKEFLASRYSEEEAQAFEQQVEALPESERPAYVLRETEQSLHAIITKKTKKPLLPPQVIQGRYAYKDFPTVPDCVETASLEALVNMLLYNPQTGAYDRGLVGDKTAPRKEFVDFLAHITPATINSKQVRTAWMNLVSGHDFMRYNREQQYEMLSLPSNILALANYLYGLEAQNVTELADLLSSPLQKVRMKLEEYQDNTAQIIIELSGIKNTRFRVKLDLMHGSVERKYHVPSSGLQRYLRNAAATESTHHRALLGVPLSKDSYDSLALILSEASLKNTDDPNVRLRIFTDLARTHSQKPAVIDALMRLIRSMPDDRHFQESIFKACLKYGYLELLFSIYKDSFRELEKSTDRTNIYREIRNTLTGGYSWELSEQEERVFDVFTLTFIVDNDFLQTMQAIAQKEIFSFTGEPLAVLRTALNEWWNENPSKASARVEKMIHFLFVNITLDNTNNLFYSYSLTRVMEWIRECLAFAAGHGLEDFAKRYNLYAQLNIIITQHDAQLRKSLSQFDTLVKGNHPFDECYDLYRRIKNMLPSFRIDVPHGDKSESENQKFFFRLIAISYAIDNNLASLVDELVCSGYGLYSENEEWREALADVVKEWWDKDGTTAERLKKLLHMIQADSFFQKEYKHEWIRLCFTLAKERGIVLDTLMQNDLSKQATPSTQPGGFMQWIASFFKR